MARAKTIDNVDLFLKIISYLIDNENDFELCNVKIVCEQFNISLEHLKEIIDGMNVLGHYPYLPQNLCQAWIEEEYIFFKLCDNVFYTKKFLKDNLAFLLELNSKSTLIEIPINLNHNIKIESKSNEIIQTISKAISNNRIINCVYNDKERKYFPKKIFISKGKQYLVVLDVDKDEKRILLVSKILNVQVGSHYTFNESISSDFEFEDGENILVEVEDEFVGTLLSYPQCNKISENQFEIQGILPNAFSKLFLQCQTKLRILKASDSFVYTCNTILNK